LVALMGLVALNGFRYAASHPQFDKRLKPFGAARRYSTNPVAFPDATPRELRGSPYFDEYQCRSAKAHLTGD